MLRAIRREASECSAEPKCLSSQTSIAFANCVIHLRYIRMWIFSIFRIIILHNGIIKCKRAAHTSHAIRPRASLVRNFKRTPSVGPEDSEWFYQLRSFRSGFTTIRFGAEGKQYAQPVQGLEIKTRRWKVWKVASFFLDLFIYTLKSWHCNQAFSRMFGWAGKV